MSPSAKPTFWSHCMCSKIFTFLAALGATTFALGFLAAQISAWTSGTPGRSRKVRATRPTGFFVAASSARKRSAAVALPNACRAR